MPPVSKPHDAVCQQEISNKCGYWKSMCKNQSDFPFPCDTLYKFGSKERPKYKGD